MANIMNLFSRAIRTPVFQFLFLGGLIFIVNVEWRSRTLNNTGNPYHQELVITAKKIDQLRSDLIAKSGLTPTPRELQSAIQEAIDEEILYRETLSLGLDRGSSAIRQRLIQIARFVAEDPDQDEDALYELSLKLGLNRSDLVVRRYLVTKMRLIAERVPMDEEVQIPTDAELEKFIHQNPEKYIFLSSVRFSHVYLSKDRRGMYAKADARRMLKELQSKGIDPMDASKQGDPFLLGQHNSWKSHKRLEQLFGPDFANSVMGLPIAEWSGPIQSSYGWHIVWLHGKQKDKLPTVDSVRNKVLNDLLQVRREKRLRETLSDLRAKYSIRVEYPKRDISSLSLKDSDD
ncbi:MAG TPA: peptidyl-prolyl cis-trans isomerase [Thermodesulfobacteriota bacterium]|jgi:hypothetical protein